MSGKQYVQIYKVFSKYYMWFSAKLYFYVSIAPLKWRERKLKEHTEKKHGKDIQEKPNLKFWVGKWHFSSVQNLFKATCATVEQKLNKKDPFKIYKQESIFFIFSVT